MRFEWDPEKDRNNLLKHKVAFATATLVFDDPHALTQIDDRSGDEERWLTLGAIGTGAVLFVLHTWRDEDGETVIRIISARPATRRERKQYEEAEQRAKKGYRRNPRHPRRRH